MQVNTFEAQVAGYGATLLAGHQQPLLANNEELDVEDVCGQTFNQEKTVIDAGKYLVVGGLVYDRDTEDPTKSCDAEGRIVFAGRRGSAEDIADYWDAFGRNSDGSPNVEASAVADELADLVWERIRKNSSLRMTLFNMLKRHGRAHGDVFSVKEALQKAANAGSNQDWAEDAIADAFTSTYRMARLDDKDQERLAPLVALFEELRESAWEAAVEKGTVGNPFAVMLDVYEHGGMVLSVSGEGMQCRWDTSRGGAVWIPDSAALENIRYQVLDSQGVGKVSWFGALGSKTAPLHAKYSLDGVNWAGHFQHWGEAMAALKTAWRAQGNVEEEELLTSLEREMAVKYCRGVLESYNAWLSGECFGVCVYALDKKTGELADKHTHEVWGYIGESHAAEELQREVLGLVARLQKEDDHV